MTVIPISQSIADWSNYLSLANKAIGRSLTKSLDKANMPANDMAAFIVTLAEMKHGVENPLTLLREAGQFLHHVSLSFLVAANEKTFNDIREVTELHVTFGKTVVPDIQIGIISGNLHQWRMSIVDGCTEKNSYSVRDILGKCLRHFEQANLGHIWAFYRKAPMPDGTFRLEKK